MCGRPRGDARALLADSEAFDRGFYAGPFGWLSGCAAEFVVAIRSALLHGARPLGSAPVPVARRISLYAGVGIVRGSDVSSEVCCHDFRVLGFWPEGSNAPACTQHGQSITTLYSSRFYCTGRANAIMMLRGHHMPIAQKHPVKIMMCVFDYHCNAERQGSVKGSGLLESLGWVSSGLRV